MRSTNLLAGALLIALVAACDNDKIVNNPPPPPGEWFGFEEAATWQVGGTPSAVAVGDINGDSRDDIVTLDTVLGGARIATATAAGGYTTLGSITLGAGALDLRLADMTRDHVADILVVSGSNLKVSPGGNGGPGVATNYPVNGPVRALAVGDLDSDLRADVSVVTQVVNDRVGMTLHVSKPNGTIEKFMEFSSFLAATAVRACVVDVTGEGHADVVVASSNPQAPLIVLPNHGGIALESPTVSGQGVLTGHAQARLACADFDNDGDFDVMVLEPGTQAVLAYFTGSMAGLTLAGSDMIGEASDIAAINANGDADVDLLIARPGDGGVDIAFGLGGGDFDEPALILTGTTPRLLTVADVNRDGFLDIVIANTGGTVSVLRNTGY